MSMTEIVKVFGERKIRSVWDDVAEEWYFSVVDVVAVLTESADPATYWRVLKNRLKHEGNETVTNCNRLKLRAEDGKMRLADVATPEQMFRLIQSIPSPNAEPFKVWMAKVAAERLNQLQDPELSIQQALADYRRLGYSEESTRQISSATRPKTILDHSRVAKSGGGVAKNARLEIEKKTGQKVISPLNAADAGALDVGDGPAPLPGNEV